MHIFQLHAPGKSHRSFQDKWTLCLQDGNVTHDLASRGEVTASQREIRSQEHGVIMRFEVKVKSQWRHIITPDYSSQILRGRAMEDCSE